MMYDGTMPTGRRSTDHPCTNTTNVHVDKDAIDHLHAASKTVFSCFQVYRKEEGKTVYARRSSRKIQKDVPHGYIYA